MKISINKLKLYVKKNLLFLKKILFIFSIFGLYKLGPSFFIDKPELMEMYPESVLVNTKFNEDNIVTILGKNLDNVIGVYIDGKIEEDCWIVSNTSEEIQLVIPAHYYANVQEIDIQVQVRINSDIIWMSNKIELIIGADDQILEPTISDVFPNVLKYDGTLEQKITVYGDGYTDDSVIYIDDIAYQTKYDEKNGCLQVDIPYENWCMKEFLLLKVVQYYGEYPTQKVTDIFYYETEGNEICDEFFQDQEFNSSIRCTSANEIVEAYENGVSSIQLDVGYSADEVLYIIPEEETYHILPPMYEKLDVTSFKQLLEVLRNYPDLIVYLNFTEVETLKTFSVLYNKVILELNSSDVNPNIVIVAENQVQSSWLAKQEDGISYIQKLKAIENENEETNEEINELTMMKYLESLDTTRYSVFFVAKDEASTGMTSDVQNALYELGLKESLVGAYRESYLAIIEQGILCYEEIGKEKLQYVGEVSGKQVKVESGNFEAGNIASIQIEGVEYAINSRGLNIVVYDTVYDKVIDSVCFDTYYDLSAIR